MHNHHKKSKHSKQGKCKKSDTPEFRLELSDDSDIEVHRTSNLVTRWFRAVLELHIVFLDALELTWGLPFSSKR